MFSNPKPVGLIKRILELGAKEEDIPVLVETLCRGDGRDGTISGFVTLNEGDQLKSGIPFALTIMSGAILQ